MHIHTHIYICIHDSHNLPIIFNAVPSKAMVVESDRNSQKVSSMVVLHSKPSSKLTLENAKILKCQLHSHITQCIE